MDRKAIIAVLAVGVVCAVSGCGTFLNTAYCSPEEGGQRVYGGVQFDVGQGAKCLKDEPSRPTSLALGVYFLAVDLPLSAIGDTLTLPWLCAVEIARLNSEPRPLVNGSSLYDENDQPVKQVHLSFGKYSR